MSDSTLYLYTSLTAGSSHIVTATARLETILKANKLPFRAIDVATDDAARKLWGRRSKGKKLPGLVKFGTVVGDLEEIEEWNEYGELRMQVNSVEDFHDNLPATSYPAPTTTSSSTTPTTESAPPKQSTIKIQNPPVKETPKDDSISVAMKQASEEAAAKAKENKGTTTTTTSKPAVSSTSTAPAATPTPTTAPETKKQTGAGEKAEEESVRRKSVAAEIAEQDGVRKRPPLAMPEVAAVSSANFRADYAESIGLVGHHRGSIVSATSKEEKEQVAQDLRKSISGGHQDILNSLRDENAEKKEEVITSVRLIQFNMQKFSP
ncbi:hypothetical protein ASPWEDRAFT_54076 [Aspergillus wentii DTO 134E9]|uniref:Uncharacterized protein n=1 Tax=Aspergillus wentii DTO 134E9 TaxID=1073089 RepID=A0A1L9RC43_ASPWE|nr:uncharacterized protein ASPWEDRAFT_54076 [Aspergillus wentii DTO 134E9]OJJ32482.1 hypothetical protein ASPWEDRAFT_54076 [Aspergillus wentii DTO 134E9]